VLKKICGYALSMKRVSAKKLNADNARNWKPALGRRSKQNFVPKKLNVGELTGVTKTISPAPALNGFVAVNHQNFNR
jgi:hypothetical protein